MLNDRARDPCDELDPGFSKGLINGRDGRGTGSWQGTAIETLLPVELDTRGQLEGPGGQQREIKFTPTEAGLRHFALRLDSDASTRQRFPHDFRLLYEVHVGSKLSMALHVTNLGSQPIRFEEALHTYFRVSDVRQVAVEGLDGATYIDKTDGMSRKKQEGPVTISGETDRVYLDTTSTVWINDAGGNRRITVEKEGSRATVVWNPWVNKARAMTDFGDDEWPAMLCVETVNAADVPVSLPAGATHVMTATIGSE